MCETKPRKRKTKEKIGPSRNRSIVIQNEHRTQAMIVCPDSRRKESGKMLKPCVLALRAVFDKEWKVG